MKHTLVLVLEVENIDNNLLCRSVKCKSDLKLQVADLVPPGSIQEIEFTVSSVNLFEPDADTTSVESSE